MSARPRHPTRPRNYSTPLTSARPPRPIRSRTTPNIPSSSIRALDLQPSASKSLSALASVRLHVLQYLADLEARLALADFNAVKERASAVVNNSVGVDDPLTSESAVLDEEGEEEDVELAVEDVAELVDQGIELLHRIRSDVCSYLPDINFDFDFATSQDNLRTKIHDFESDVRSKFSEFPAFEMPTMDSFNNLRSQISDIAPSSPLSYIPTLQVHLATLQTHMQELPFPVSPGSTLTLPGLPGPPKVLSELLNDLLEEDTEEAIEKDIQKAKEEEGTMKEQIQKALIKSDQGRRLVKFEDLPDKWRNNEYIREGYRFIPSSRWPALLASVFQLHNETLNIHTHFIPALSILSVFIPYIHHLFPSSFAVIVQPSLDQLARTIPSLFPENSTLDVLPSRLFILSAICCLLCSVVWHTCAGCSDHHVVEQAARGDYIGIGWLISASVASVVYYGFNCQSTHLRLYTSLCIVTGIAGSIVPFMTWFNERRHKKWRIVFFLVLAFTSLLPLAHMSFSKGPLATVLFVSPVLGSCACYLAGLTLYASHFPECYFPAKWDWGGSHALWHIFIVVAIRSHYIGLSSLKMESASFSCAIS